MAEEAAEDTGGGIEAAAGGGDEGGGPPVKCPECPPGLPGWMATFSDLVTLLLTFFVLLLSFAKTETAKYEAALGSIRDAFGGNVLRHGEVVVRGKSPDNTMTMIEAQQPLRPFPIDFLTMEGLLEKNEINRESSEILDEMKKALAQNELADVADVFQTPEGVRIQMKDKIYFQEGSTQPTEVNVRTFQKVINTVKENNWNIIVSGHSSRGEVSTDRTKDAYVLSSYRAAAVTRTLIKRGISPQKITTVFYGDSRPDTGYANATDSPEKFNRRVEFTLRKIDMRSNGTRVEHRK